MSSINTRLAKLAAVYRRPEGCDACRAWTWTVLANDDGERERPECCPACGRRVPIRLVLVTVGVDFRAI